MTMCAALAIAAPAHAAPGDAIVEDNGGEIYAVNPITGATTLVSDDARSQAAGGAALFGGGDLFGIAREPGGTYVAIERRGDQNAPNPNPSRLIRIDPATGRQSLVANDPNLTYGLTSVAVGAGGVVYIGDENTPDNSVADSAVFKVDPLTGQTADFTSNSRTGDTSGNHLIDAPEGLTVDPDGTLWVLADTGGDNAAACGSDFTGAITRVDPTTGHGSLFTSNCRSVQAGGARLFDDPRSIARAPGGDFFVVDDPELNDATHFTAADGQIIRVDAVTGAQRLVSSNAASVAAGGQALFDRPYGIAIAADGSLLVGDDDRLIRVNPATGAQTLVAHDLGYVRGVMVEPGTPAGGGGGKTDGGGSTTTTTSTTTSTAAPPPPPTASPAASAATAPAATTPPFAVTLPAAPHGASFVGSVAITTAGSSLEVDAYAPSGHGLGAAGLVKVATVTKRALPVGPVHFRMKLTSVARKTLHKRGRLALTLVITVSPPGLAPRAQTMKLTVRG